MLVLKIGFLQPRKQVLFFWKKTAWTPESWHASEGACRSCQLSASLRGSCFWVGVRDEDQLFRIQAFSLEKVKLFSFSFQETIVYSKRERGRIFSYCLWEFCLWVIPMEIGPIWLINIVKPCLTALRHHVLSRDGFRLSKAGHLHFVFLNPFLTHSIFSHGKHYCYYRLCLVNGLNVTFVCLVYHWQVSSRSLAALRKNKMGTNNS